MSWKTSRPSWSKWEGQKIALFRVGQAFHALSDTCTHRGGPAAVRRDGRGSRGDLPLARGEVRHQDRGCHEAAGGTRGQELPGAGQVRAFDIVDWGPPKPETTRGVKEAPVEPLPTAVEGAAGGPDRLAITSRGRPPAGLRTRP